MRRLLVPLALGLLSFGCGGAQHGDDSDWSPEPAEKRKRLRVSESLNGPALDPVEKGPAAVLGVRHDLMLSNTPHEVRCSCLSVEVGRPDDPRFFWAGGAPDVAGDAVIIAVGSRGISCPGGDPDDRRRRPSISAVEHDGEDVIVEVEDLAPGRPLASGAIIPRPGLKGALYVVPKRNNPVYGRGPNGGRCRVQ